MELHELAVMGAKYIARLITGSKTFDNAKESVLSKSWKWVKEHIFKINPAVEEKVNSAADDKEKESILTRELFTMLQQESFREEFLEWIKPLQGEPTLKNYFAGETGDIKGDVTIGDKLKTGQASTNEYDKKNIVTGKMGNIEGGFHVGDTHE